MKPYLYSVVDEIKLADMLKTFNECMDIPIQVLDENGEILQAYGDTTAFCNIFKRHLPNSESCKKLHANASKKAMVLGETYIFSCHANLNHIVFPLISRKSLFGSILAGPFLMDDPDSLLIGDIAKRYPIPSEELLEMYDESRQLVILPPTRVTYLSRLLYYLFSGLIADSKEQLLTNQGKLLQQSRINESIQMYKNSGYTENTGYPYETEKRLISKVKVGDAKEAKALLNELLGYVFFAGGSKLEIVKSRSIELCSLLSRAAIEGGATTDSILKINNQFLQTVQEVYTLDDLCYRLQDTIDVFTDSMFDRVPAKNNELIKKAIHYISKNFAAAITLDEVAKQVHLNPAYFSTTFKQSTGSSFKEYLNMVRIEESKRLLANTDYAVIDIAIATGFENQSYFSKVFKKYTGLTPKQYR